MGASRDDTIATSKGELEIHAIHHASLMLMWNEVCALIDPAPGPGTPLHTYKSLPTPDLIVFTHSHYDHFDAPLLSHIAGHETQIVAPLEVYELEPEALRPRTKVVRNGERASVLGVPFEAVPMYNTSPDKQKFHPKGMGNGYILMFGGKRVYVAGDTEEAPELAHLENIDVAFVPMNQPYTLTVDAAAKWVRDFRPMVVYPYHFRSQDGSFSDLAMFKAKVGGASDVRVLDWY